MSRSSAVIRSERSDAFNKYLRLPVALAVVAYVTTTLLSSNTQEELPDGYVAHRARDTHAFMLLRSPFSKLHLNLHASVSIVTVLLMLYARTPS